MPISIVMLLHNLNGGGIQNYVKEVSRCYLEQGYSVYIVCNQKVQTNYGFNTLYYEYHTRKGLKELYSWLSGINDFRLFAHTYDSYKATYKLRKWDSTLNDKFFDVIHVDYHALYYRWYTPIKNLERSFHYRKFFNGANLLSVSRGAISSLTDLVGVKPKYTKVIGAPINLEAIKNKAQEQSEGIPEKPYMVLVSRLAPRKNIAMAIKALCESKSSLLLLIVGSGSELKKLTILVKNLSLENQVIFVGWKANPFPYIKNAQFLVSTSNIEGFGLTLAESMALGVPVVSTDAKSGPKEILGECYSDLLIPLNDISALACILNKYEELFVEDRFNEVSLIKHIERFNSAEVAKDMFI